MSDNTCSMGGHPEWNEIIITGTGTSVPDYGMRILKEIPKYYYC